MATKKLIKAKKNRRKVAQTRGAASRRPAPRRVSATDEETLSSRQVAAVPAESSTVFDPLLILTRLVGGKSTQEYQSGESVFAQGDKADAVFYIQSGKAKMTVVSKRGKEAVIAILPAGSFLGESCMAGQPLRMASASAVERSTIIRVEKSAMVQLLHQEPEFAERFLDYLLSRNIRMEADLVDHLFNSGEKRLARLLLLLANFGQESKPIPMIAKMSQETLAEMIGTTRSRVSFFMNRFRELGFIEYNGGGMNVHSSLVSVVLHD
jgi:CRP/FNR family transcriptional regulator, cyclic AMP receptor protein